MCTLVLLHRCVAGRPLVVAANRDEFVARPTEDLAIRSTRRGPMLSPLDLEAGGTWLGLNAHGVFAGLTNLRPRTEREIEGADPKAPRSRGEIVVSALEAETAVDAAEALRAVPPGTFNPFQLVVADGEEAHLVVHRGHETVAKPLTPGIHVVGNVEREESGGRRESEPRALKLERIHREVDSLMADTGDDLFEGLARICRAHELDPIRSSPFESTCVHIQMPEVVEVAEQTADDDHYGTRSSMLLELSQAPGSSRLWATDGPPCRRPYENRSSLLKDLGLG